MSFRSLLLTYAILMQDRLSRAAHPDAFCRDVWDFWPWDFGNSGLGQEHRSGINHQDPTTAGAFRIHRKPQRYAAI